MFFALTSRLFSSCCRKLLLRTRATPATGSFPVSFLAQRLLIGKTVFVKRTLHSSMSAATPAAAAAEAAETTKAQPPHLVLHFDVNKTILLCDPVSGMDVLGMLQSCVSECAWGLVDETTGEWKLTHPEPLFVAPSEKHTTYSDFLEYGKFKLVDNSSGDAAVAAQNKKAKADKKSLKKVFTDPGQPGQKMRHVFSAMVQKLRIPEALREKCAQHELEHLHGEFAFLLPSFFRSLDSLQREGRTFSVIFRTFGTETQEVADSFNAFRKGTHPFVPQPACTDPVFHSGTIEFPKQLGCFKRSVDADTGSETIRLCLGTIDPSEQEPFKVITGFADIHAFLEQESRKGISFALRDDYPFWASRAEASDAGKPHAVNPQGTSCHHIFFDDNIERTHAHIVDCRDVSRGGAVVIPFEESLNHWMVKAEPVQALMDDLYFRKAIARCEENVAKLRKSL